MTVLTFILQSICNAAFYNKHELAAPRMKISDRIHLWETLTQLDGLQDKK
jgi:hypothetical protein